MAASTSRTHPPLPPYLGSWALASLAFTSPIVLSLILVAVRLILAINSANTSIIHAKQSLTSSCLGLEKSASAAASFPHYLAGNVNNATADSAEAIVHGLGTVLDMSVLGVEKIVTFVLDMYRSLYLCLADFVVRGTLNLGIEATQEFSSFLNSTFSEIRSDIQSAFTDATSAIDSAVSGLNKLPGVNIQPPHLDAPSLPFLNNVQIPSGFMNGLLSLNNSLPTLDEVKQKMNSIVAIPFEDLRHQINGTLLNAKVDRSLFPVPARESMTFCQDLDVSFVDNVGHELVKVAEYGLIVIALVIVAFCAVMVAKERIMFRGIYRFVEVTRLDWANSQHAEQIGSNPVISRNALLGFTTAVFNPILRGLPSIFNRIPRLRRSARARSNITWFVAYITYLPALLLLLVGVLGLLSVEIQLAALKPTEAQAQDQVNQGLSGFKQTVLSKINNATEAKGYAFANDSNTVIIRMEDDINKNMFGWVNATTTTLNASMVELYSDITGAVNSTFGSTPLASPALQLIKCLIGSKVDALSEAMTWLHDNAHVTLPRVKNDIFMLSPSASDELVSSLDAPASTSGPSSVVKTLMQEYRGALQKERWSFLLLIGLYLLVVLLGVLAIIGHEYVLPRWRPRSGSSKEISDDEKPATSAFDSASRQETSFTSRVRTWIARLARRPPSLRVRNNLPPYAQHGSQYPSMVVLPMLNHEQYHRGEGTAGIYPYGFNATEGASLNGPNQATRHPSNPFISPFDNQ